VQSTVAIARSAADLFGFEHQQNPLATAQNRTSGVRGTPPTALDGWMSLFACLISGRRGGGFTDRPPICANPHRCHWRGLFSARIQNGVSQLGHHCSTGAGFPFLNRWRGISGCGRVDPGGSVRGRIPSVVLVALAQFTSPTLVAAAATNE
jgi:hypothetical protein